MASKLQEMTYFDLKGLKKAAAFRGERKLEMRVMDEMDRRVNQGLVTSEELEAAAYL
jgi:hypothetical protein